LDKKMKFLLTWERQTPMPSCEKFEHCQDFWTVPVQLLDLIVIFVKVLDHKTFLWAYALSGNCMYFNVFRVRNIWIGIVPGRNSISCRRKVCSHNFLWSLKVNKNREKCYLESTGKRKLKNIDAGGQRMQRKGYFN
jgi:hypothetical protein